MKAHIKLTLALAILSLSFGLSACSTMEKITGEYESPYEHKPDVAKVETNVEPMAVKPAEQATDLNIPIHQKAYESEPSDPDMDGLVWSDWSNEPVGDQRSVTSTQDIEVLTPTPITGEAVPLATSYQQTAKPAEQNYNASVTVYPIDDALTSNEEGVDFWQVMTVDSRGVNTQDYDGHMAMNSGLNPVPMFTTPSGEAYSIYFKHGSAQLTAAERQQLQSMAQNAGQYLVRVTGYASTAVEKSLTEVEKHIVNLNMGGIRATRVSAELMRQGVPVQNLETVSRGAAFAGPDPKEDRRVDVQVLSK